MDEVYKNWEKARDEAKIQFAITLEKHQRVSSTIRGDYEVKLETIQENIAYYEKQMEEYEQKHFDRFDDLIEEKAATPKMVRQSKKSKTIDRNLRADTLTEQILNIMIDNTFVHSMEKTLSADKRHWTKAKIDIPDKESNSYTFWYCFFQAQHYRQSLKDLVGLNPTNFTYDIKPLLHQLEIQNKDLKAVIPIDKKVALYRHLTTLDDFIEETQYELITCPDTDAQFRKLKMALKNCLEQLVMGLMEVGNAALDCMNKGGQVENSEQVV